MHSERKCIASEGCRSQVRSGEMKRSGILNPDLLAMLANWGHTDFITICDRGFPVPSGPPRVDLSLVDDIPTVLDVLKAVHGEFELWQILVPSEARDISPGRIDELKDTVSGIPLRFIPHLEFKHLTAESKGIIRTADTCPYGNIIIISG
jgi:D-ribose pyranase